jgi:hypothetical protein
MPPTPRPLPVDELLCGLALRLRGEQRRLDEDHAERLAAFKAVIEAARAAGDEQLARGLAPPSVVVAVAEVETRLRLSVGGEGGFALKVQPLDLGFMRRYAHSAFAQSTLEVTVRRVPAAPGRRDPRQP